MISKAQLKIIMPFATEANLEKYCQPLNEAMVKYEINNHKRIAAFIAQLAHESGSFRYVEELATGKDYDTGTKAVSLGNTLEADGDGERYKGRGLIQITGKTNYERVSKALGIDFLSEPEKLELPLFATESAAWFWKSRGLNELADIDDFTRITKRINGGLNGFAQRLEFWERAKLAL